jgi:putative endonuclease
MKTRTHAQRVGRWGEELAAGYLSQRGYRILDRNARTPYGEIDLVACQDEMAPACTVFVEVKTRRSGAFGLPEEALTARKRAHLLAAARAYLQTHPDLNADWRIDVIAIRQLRIDEEPEILCFENAISAE